MNGMSRISRFAPFVAVTALILYSNPVFAECRGVYSQMCTYDSGSGGGTDPGYYDVPVYQPSAFDIASQRSSALHKQAWDADNRGDYQEAIRLYYLALEAAPSGKDTSVTRVNLGRSYHKLADAAFLRMDYAEAVRLFQLAISNIPNEQVTIDYLAIAKDTLANQQREQQRTAELETARQRIAGLLGASPALQVTPNGSPESGLDYWDGSPETLGSGEQTAGGDGQPPTSTSDSGELFSRGDKNSAPVIFAPRTAFLAVEPNTSGGSAIMGAVETKPADNKASPDGSTGNVSTTEKKPLLTGAALEAAEFKAKADAALSMAARFFRRGDYESAHRYIDEAQRMDPKCASCKYMFDKVKQSEETYGLFDRLMGTKPKPSTEVDSIMDALDKSMDEALLGGGSKTAHVMTAFQYGKGDWSASIRYLEDLKKASPDDKTVDQALEFSQMLRASVQVADAAGSNK